MLVVLLNILLVVLLLLLIRVFFFCIIQRARDSSTTYPVASLDLLVNNSPSSPDNSSRLHPIGSTPLSVLGAHCADVDLSRFIFHHLFILHHLIHSSRIRCRWSNLWLSFLLIVIGLLYPQVHLTVDHPTAFTIKMDVDEVTWVDATDFNTGIIDLVPKSLLHRLQ